MTGHAAGPIDLGVVLAACADRLGIDATSVLARLAGPVGEAARRGTIELTSLPERERQERRAEVATRVRVVSSRDLRAVHPSWLDAALADLPARARTAIEAAGEPVDVWLARWLAASLPGPLAAETGELSALVQRDGAALLAWLRAIAFDQLAFALGERAPVVLHEAIARISHPPRAGALGSHRAALVRCRGAAVDDDAAMVAIASRALAPHLASYPIARLHLTRRMPYQLGVVIEAELVANAMDRDGPAWSALVAA